MNLRKIFAIPILFLLLMSLTPVEAAQAAGTDEIKVYTIDILPQEDGSLITTYTIHWCVISNSAGPLQWFTVGMPNENYQILSSSGDVSSVRPNNEGFDSMVRIDLPHEVNAGDCVNVSVQVHQYGLAILDENTQEIEFHFTPGWFNDVPVDKLQVTWHLPAVSTGLKTVSPKPTAQYESRLVWEADLLPGEKFPIKVVYERGAFPGFNPEISTGSSSPGVTTPGAIQVTQGTSISEDTEGTGSPALGITLPLLFIPCLCIVLIIVLVVIILVIRLFLGVGRIYRGGGFFGGYHGGGGWFGGGGSGSGGGGGGSISLPRSGGGSGSFGGRGSSCACVSSGCACACAGGVRAGCSRKGFDVSGLFKEKPGKKTG
jgi:hypothetical protein